MMPMDDKDVQRMRDELQSMNDGSVEFDELYSTYSWFAQRFVEFIKFHKSPSKMMKL